MDSMKRVAEAKISQLFTTGLPIRLHLRTDLHLARKMWHMSMGLVIAFCYLSGMRASTAIVTLSCILGLDLFLETARLRIPAVNEAILKVWAPFMRSHELERMSTIPYYLTATILAIGIFPKPVAILSILYLACGDPMASVFGILYGNRSIRLASGKSLIGTLAGVATCSVLTFVYLKTLPLADSSVYALTLVGGLAGGTAELVPFDVDDNFTIPVISGFSLWLAFILLGV